MTDEISGKPRVPKEELEELVEEWRGSMIAASDREIRSQNRVYSNCSDELEALIERYDYGV